MLLFEHLDEVLDREKNKQSNQQEESEKEKDHNCLLLYAASSRETGTGTGTGKAAFEQWPDCTRRRSGVVVKGLPNMERPLSYRTVLS